MFVSINKKQAILSVDNEKMFCELIDQDSDFLFYRVSYSVDIIAAISSEIPSVKITTRKYNQPVINSSANSSYSKSKLDLRLITARRDRKRSIRSKSKGILSEVYKNIKDELDDDLYFQIKNFLESENKNLPSISGIRRSDNTLKIFKNKNVLERVKNIDDSNKDYPVIQLNNIGVTGSNIDQAFVTDIILKNKIDPATIADTEDYSLSYSRLISGLQSKRKSISKNANLDLLKKSFVSTSDQPDVRSSKDIVANRKQFITTRKNVFNNLYTFSHIIKVKKDDINDEQFIVVIELIDNNGSTVDSFSNVIKVRNQQFIKNKVRNPPSIQIAKSNHKVRLTLSSSDKNSKNILLYRKLIKPYQPVLANSSYEYIGTVTIPAGLNSVTRELAINSTGPTIYRAVSEDRNGELSPLFSSAIVSSSEKTEIYGSSIETISLNDGIEITVNEFPRTAIAVGIVRRDATLNEKLFSLIDVEGEQIRLINNSLVRTFMDKKVKNNHTYEYAARFFYKNGTEKQSGNSLIEFIPLEKNKYYTTIEPIQAAEQTEDSVDFSFSINTEIGEDGLDLIKNLLDKAGISEFFNSDLQLERDKFNELLAYNVTRTNLTTGQIENFGNISGTDFSDSVNGRSAGVRPLEPGNVYRYAVKTLIRSPETLFEKFQKQSLDRNGTEYSFFPFKFRHPIALKRGNIPTKESLVSNYAKTELDFGDVGDIATTIFSYKKKYPSITSASANQINRNTVVINWSAAGDLSMIDHFIVMKKTIDINSIVAKTHANNTAEELELTYELSEGDIGEISFIIIPVYNDYSRGKEAETNTVVYSG
jgi:hypothetical protein